jgi:DNA repair photolyase
MKIIYQPGPKAREYSDLAANLFTGCSHGCLYCYVPNLVHKERDHFHGSVEPRKGILENLTREAHVYTDKEVFLCFTCDPYCPEEETQKITHEAVKILHNADVGVNILTKGAALARRDFPLFLKQPFRTRIGVTLTFNNDADSLKWEPNASLPRERIKLLYEAHHNGLRTWASLEPVIDPEQTLDLIKTTAPYVDIFKVGRWNYDSRASSINYADFLRDVTKLFKDLGASYYIKKDLACFSDKALS